MNPRGLGLLDPGLGAAGYGCSTRYANSQGEGVEFSKPKLHPSDPRNVAADLSRLKLLG